MAVTVNLGRVQPLYRGPYLASFPYRPLDFVTFEGVTYYCIKPVTGTAPPDPEFWVSILQLPLGLAAGGTGAITAEGARTALGATNVGGAVFTAADAQAARGALGASSVGGSVFVAEDQAAARAAIGATSVGSAVFTAANPAAARAALEILQAIAANPFLSEPLGKPFLVWDHIPGADIPDNSGTAKFIRLIAGQSGAGGYNEGLLTGEQVSGSAPDIVATAEIMVGPMAGQRIPLIGTEMSFIRPGTDSGERQATTTQSHKHRMPSGFDGSSFYGWLNASNHPIFGSEFVSNAGRLSTGGVAQGGQAVRLGYTDTMRDITGESRPPNRQATPYARVA